MFSSLKLFGSVSVRDLALAEPRFEVQVALAGVHTVVWFVMSKYVVPPIAKRIISGLKNKDKFLALFRESVKNILQYDMGDDPVKQLEEASEFEVVFLQHGVGGGLCLPSVLGLTSWLPLGLAGALARHGALCEVGFEISDVGQRIFQCACGGEEGRAKSPMSLMLMLLMHHSAAQMMVLPLNLYYPENVYYHEGVFLLQFAAIVAFSIQQYGWTLDITTPTGLRRMKISTGACLGIMTWGRVLRYGYVWWKLISTFVEDGNTFVLKMALPPVVLLSLFNIALVGDCVHKFCKFYNKTTKLDHPGDVHEAAIQAPVSPLALRSRTSCFGSTPEQKEGANIPGAVLLGAVSHKKKVT